jgi:hypothetical protein
MPCRTGGKTTAGQGGDVLAVGRDWRLKPRQEGSLRAAAKPASARSGENTRRQPSRQTWYEALCWRVKADYLPLGLHLTTKLCCAKSAVHSVEGIPLCCGLAGGDRDSQVAELEQRGAMNLCS